MPTVLIATNSGCRVFAPNGEASLELPGQQVHALAPCSAGSCTAIVNQYEIWRRLPTSAWSHFATSPIALQSLTLSNETIFAGAADEATILSITGHDVNRVSGFNQVPGRGAWFANGPPLGVRSLATTADRAVLLAAVHVGGIPRSSNYGQTWAPTLPIEWDVHEVCAHPSRPNLVAAAAAVGLCISQDAGLNWNIVSKGLDITNSLAVAALEDQFLFSIQDGPFAESSQLWRYRLDCQRLEQVRDGLPERLTGKVDTAHLAARNHQAALVDAGGYLWRSTVRSTGWQQVAAGLKGVFGLAMLDD